MEEKPHSFFFADQATKLLLTLGFFALFFAFSAWQRALGYDLEKLTFSASDLILLAFATVRLGRMIAYDLVMEPFRRPFTRTVKDITGVGDTVVPRSGGIRRAVGQLLCCPICVGTWVSAGLVYAMVAWPAEARILVTIVGVVGIAEVLNGLIEALSWSGVLSRTRTGEILSARKEKKE